MRPPISSSIVPSHKFVTASYADGSHSAKADMPPISSSIVPSVAHTFVIASHADGSQVARGVSASAREFQDAANAGKDASGTHAAIFALPRSTSEASNRQELIKVSRRAVSCTRVTLAAMIPSIEWDVNYAFGDVPTKIDRLLDALDQGTLTISSPYIGRGIWMAERHTYPSAAVTATESNNAAFTTHTIPTVENATGSGAVGLRINRSATGSSSGLLSTFPRMYSSAAERLKMVPAEAKNTVASLADNEGLYSSQSERLQNFKFGPFMLDLDTIYSGKPEMHIPFRRPDRHNARSQEH
ncbi:uncharacterized protein MYCFIDRAFT_180458 [Pseudocercospora fijiensis CIRAD86]|uniref:Uncharacterized protein n=1 Tax=Pseudocercospora fijiensis (strain CIRAD86) TaxID=383855 RepID=M3AIE0_PSEFD|nr:uncharacterized protein MYCFIDRAFT_180458 [Pseudocercospora fijiensis CIRAD86]EME76973.1 hypothetical protein MYCFIDRAFT_180458 [Pseudocercospora fijiensis CIRAD86]